MGFMDRVTRIAHKSEDAVKAVSVGTQAAIQTANSGYGPGVVVGTGVCAAAATTVTKVMTGDTSGLPGDTVDFHEPRDITNTPSGVEVRWRRG